MMTTNAELPGHFISRSGFIRVDRRTTQRKPIFKFAIITYDPDRRILSVIKNLSATGAMLEVDNALEIPDRFMLAIEAEPFARLCRVAWKRSKQIAVNFDKSRREVNSDRTERRQAPRRSLNTVGWIRLDGSFATHGCKIIDHLRRSHQSSVCRESASELYRDVLEACEGASSPHDMAARQRDRREIRLEQVRNMVLGAPRRTSPPG